jgi:hypothetical protein
MASITTYENLPINLLIQQLINTKGSQITFDELKEELAKKDTNGSPLYYLSLKEDADLCMLYYNNIPQTSSRDQFIMDLENSCRSIILDKNVLKPVVTQYNKILYNNESLEFLKDKKWENVVVQKCYEGTLIMVFNNNNKWYVTTRRCLDAQESTWIKNNSYFEMFSEAMNGKFTFEELNKNYCYHFILVHHKNRNIVSYRFGREYKELFHILTTEKYTLTEVNHKINDKVKYIENESYKNLDELLNVISKQNDLDKSYQKITLEGYVLKYYYGEIYKSPFVTLKLQTNIYETLMRLKPNNSNIYQCFLELYQTDKLNEFLPYFTRYGNEVIRRINLSIKNMSKEVLDLYHMTRNKKNNDMYNELPEQYKKVLYELHGLYIKQRKDDFKDGVDDKKTGSSKSINVFNVYQYLKSMPSTNLRQLYFDRSILLTNKKFTFLNNKCIDTMTQSTLMFKNNKNKN